MKRTPSKQPGRISAWLNASPIRKWGAASLSVLAVCIGIALTLRAVLPPRSPGLAAPQEELIAFLAHNTDRIASTERDRLMDELARRYFEADARQRNDIEKQWRSTGLDRASRNRIRTQMDFALAYHLADSYQDLPPAQRGPFLDRVLVMVNAMGGGQEFLDWVASNPAADVFTDPAGTMQNADPFQRKLMYGTNAEQRAALPQFGRDLIARAKRYR